ncbi:DUF1934 domain-containing protein [Tannockella kyphosi]|uniref:DUF1934 domain-containing protein n=1 Tax=Tannockella kyphosi TaxID=2899121 RepID=UPI002010D41D|nr:DUF1934 domain-containing protein [Tannockella kyphosi]
MIKFVKVKYKAIFHYEGQEPSTVYYKGQGEFDDQAIEVSFNDENYGNIKIHIKEEEVVLTTGKAFVVLRDEIVENIYNTPYGAIVLNTRLLLVEYNEKTIKLKYEVLQEKEVIGNVFILVNMLEVDNDEVNRLFA